LSRVALAILLALAAFPAWASDGTTINAGATQDITAFSVCKRVTNGASASLYVPTKSAAEWSSFYDHPPSGVTVLNCPTGGKWVWGGWCSPRTSNCGGAACPAAYPDNVSCSPIGSTCGGFDTDPSWFYKYNCQ
jgi:hypothetical protein